MSARPEPALTVQKILLHRASILRCLTRIAVRHVHSRARIGGRRLARLGAMGWSGRVFLSRFCFCRFGCLFRFSQLLPLLFVLA